MPFEAVYPYADAPKWESCVGMPKNEPAQERRISCGGSVKEGKTRVIAAKRLFTGGVGSCS